ncbi:MAG: hypothetical protein JXL97_00155 [Bacteroidales bacterium]|nr:hypothetical protein [Bacteroidales bacterium]
MSKKLSLYFGEIKIPKLNSATHAEFKLYYNEQSVFFLRLSLIIIILATIPFFFLDYVSAPETHVIYWKIRLFFTLPAEAITLYLSFRPIILRKFQLIASISNIATNLSILAMIYISKENEVVFTDYFKGVTLVMVLSIMMRIRFRPAIINYSIITIIYLAIAIFKQKMLSSPESPTLSVIFYNNLFFLLSTFLALTIVTLILEIHIKNVFINQKTINLQKDNIEEKNAEISFQKEEIEKQKNILEKRHNEILASIHYAQSIQKAIMPTHNELKSILNHYFTIYLPKEEVSGDFYYVKNINEYSIVAVADCTGHGVPGGFLTMISYTFLDEIIKNTQIRTTGETLELLRTRIKKVFSSESDNQDGLDIALCAINQNTGLMQFSGAYNSIIVTKKNSQIEYKGTRNPIGYIQLRHILKQHTFS